MDRRLITLLAAASIAAGCQSTQPAYDPFLGRTTVPPPGTMSPPVVTPYYGTTPPPVSAPSIISSPITPGVPATPPQGQLPASPPSGFQYPHGSRQQIGGTKLSQQTPATEGGEVSGSEMAAPGSHVGTNQLRVDTRVQPASFNDDGPQALGAQAPKPSIEAPVRIVEPTVPKSTSPSKVIQAGGKTSEAGSVQQASAVRELTELPLAKSIKPAAVVPAPGTPARMVPAGSATVGTSQPAPSRTAEGYGYDPSYKWLKGQLEYSQSKRLWKLRYIPLDGETDNYGGSVVLSTTADLDGFKPGEFVTVHGTVGPGQTASRSFAPLYQLQRLERQ